MATSESHAASSLRGRPPAPWVIALLAACMAAMIATAFWPTVHNGFVHVDDPAYLTHNQMVRQGLTAESMVWALTDQHAGYWHPLTWLSHMLDVELFGLDHPGGHHAVSLAIHAVNAMLLMLVLWRMTGSLWCSVAAAAIFALHPLRVESVAWAAERKDVLSACFGLLAMWSYASYAARPRLAPYLTTALMLALSLMSKPMLVTLPCVLLLLDFWPLRRFSFAFGRGHVNAIATGAARQPMFRRASFMRLILEKLPLLAISTASSIIVYVTQRHAGATQSLDLSFTARLANAMVSYARYIWKTIWPVDLAYLYPHPERWPASAIWSAAVALLVITIAAILLARRHPFLIIAWLWFLGTLVPVIGVVQVGAQSMADRFTYFPQIGLIIIVVWSVALLARHAMAQRVVARWASAGLTVAVLLVLGAMTYAQTKVWRDSQTLYRHALRVTDDNVVAMNSLAALLHEQGHVTEASELWREAARLQPDHVDRTIDAHERALQRSPNDPHVHNNLAWYLATHPQASRRNGQRAVALAQHACALTGNSDPNMLDTLAAAHAEAGDFAAALRTARQAHELAIAANDAQLAASIAEHIRMFEALQPLRMAAP